MSTFAQDLEDSRRMIREAAPILKEKFKEIPDVFENERVKILPIEGSDNPVLKHLDLRCGIDYLAVGEKSGKTIAFSWRAVRYDRSRFKGRPWNGFSLREKRNTTTDMENCELHKQMNALDKGLLHPEYMAQAHYDPSHGDEILNVAVARTEDIYKAFKDNLFRECNPNAKEKEVCFYDVLWGKMKKKGYKIYDWYKDASCESKE